MVLRQIAEGVIVTDASGQIVFVNPIAAQIHGAAHLNISPSAYASAYALLTVDGEPYPPQDLPLARAVAGEIVTEARWRIRRPDGTVVLAAGSACPLRGRRGRQVGALLILREATIETQSAAELEEARTALHHAHKMEAIGQLTGGVAHDFNNLLTVIRSGVDLLSQHDADQERRARYIDAIGQAADRAAQLTSQLLAFARRQPSRTEVFDVADRTRKLVAMLETVMSPGVVIQARISSKPCYVRADLGQFETALMNIAVNARDAMSGIGVLSVTVEPVDGVPALRARAAIPGSFVAVSLTDTGAGIALDRLDRIFEPFYTTKDLGKGTGLGLSQVHGFAELSGGEVRVESQEGKGACFTLYVPRTSDPDAVSPGVD